MPNLREVDVAERPPGRILRAARGAVRLNRSLLVPLTLLALTGCASIPPEAPELSAELSGRISAIESAHNRLLEDYFQEKRFRIDEFIQEVWVPEFARQFFADTTISAVWDDVVASRDADDRLKFILIVAPALQGKINAKRVELMAPLEELQMAVAGRLRSEYDNMRAINSTLTALLQSASELETNRKRYLELAGVSDERMAKLIDDTSAAVSDLVERGRGAQERVETAAQYRDRLKEIIAQVRQ